MPSAVSQCGCGCRRFLGVGASWRWQWVGVIMGERVRACACCVASADWPERGCNGNGNGFGFGTLRIRLRSAATLCSALVWSGLVFSALSGPHLPPTIDHAPWTTPKAFTERRRARQHGCYACAQWDKASRDVCKGSY